MLLKINPSELTKDFIPEFKEVNGVWQRHVGLIVALFLYGAGEKVDNVDYYLTAVVARLCISDKEDNLIFPPPRYKFEKGRDRRFACVGSNSIKKSY